MSEQPPASLLVVRLSSIGDVVHTLPAYAAIRAAWPETRLGWAVEPAAAALVERLPGAPTVHVIKTQAWRRRPFRPATRRAIRDARSELRSANYEIALDFQGLAKSAYVARASGAPVIGLAAQDMRERWAGRWYTRRAQAAPAGAHIVRRGLNLIAAAGIADAPVNFPRVFNAADEESVATELQQRGIDRFIVAHGAANWPSKRWPLRRLAEVGRALYRTTALPVLWTWGPGEQHAALELALLAGEGNFASFATTLPELAALLQRTTLFVGGDSAPLHLAVAAHTPTVAIFGPTSPATLGPVDTDDEVAVNEQPCSYCHRRRCPLGTGACLEQLSVETVLAAATERLATARLKAG